jgi:hypothetical protein
MANETNSIHSKVPWLQNCRKLNQSNWLAFRREFLEATVTLRDAHLWLETNSKPKFKMPQLDDVIKKTDDEITSYREGSEYIPDKGKKLDLNNLPPHLAQKRYNFDSKTLNETVWKNDIENFYRDKTRMSDDVRTMWVCLTGHIESSLKSKIQANPKYQAAYTSQDIGTLWEIMHIEATNSNLATSEASKWTMLLNIKQGNGDFAAYALQYTDAIVEFCEY